jgi:GntR family transcriptional regulator/MocR family aminotransferase
MQIPVLLDRSRAESLTTQLVEQLRDAIRHTRIAAGARLPSSRRLSEQLGISRNTVVRAYEMLLMEGYVESRPASGIFVAASLPDDLMRPALVASAPTAPDGEPAAPWQMPMPLLIARAQDLVHQNRNRLSFDFFPGRPNAGLFPVKTWRRLLQNCLSHGGAIGLSHYGDPAGLAVLRSAIASHLAAARGVVADASRIVIVSGIQEGINIAARLFLAPGTLSAVENPCYQGAAFAFEAAGAEIASVPVDNDGLIVEELPQRPTSLLYVTPSHQYPTGHVLSAARRQEIIAWARRHGCYILEDDYDSDFRYEGSPLQAVAAMAPDCTIYLGTFSKSLGAGLRLGYMVVPEQLAEATRTAKTLLNNGNPWLEQAALAEMMRSGSYSAHLVRIRARYKDSRNSLLASLRRHFGDVDVSGEAGGLHVFWQLPPGVPNAMVVEALARRARIGVYSLPSGGAYDAHPSRLTQRGIILGYASLSPKQIEQGIARLSDVVDEALDDPHANVNALFAEQVPPPRPPIQPLGKAPAHLASNFRQQPALRARPRRRASSTHSIAREGGSPMPVVSSIYRYPIKGLSAQPLSSVVLEAKKPFPHDRVFALVRPGAPLDSDEPKWAKKGLFVMLMLEEGLASVHTHLDVETYELTVTQGNQRLLAANLADATQWTEVENLFHGLAPTLLAPPRLVRSRDGHFMDKPDNVLSLINLATVRALEEQWGFEINPLRFRANIYIDGAKPWEEFDWIGSDIHIGDARLRVDRRNGRCGATNVNPDNGRRDLDIPSSLRAAFGHKDLGVYLVVRDGGKLAIGDPVAVPQSDGFARELQPAARSSTDRQRRFMCRGCYFIYEEARGLPQQSIRPGTSFADIPSNWRCPDCGTEKTTFRPYVANAATKRPVQEGL